MEIRLDGGNTGGAIRVDDTVRRAAGPWSPTVHALLAHLANKGFAGSPRPLGFDAQGREVLTFVAGETVGNARPWPAWVYADDTLVQVAHWMRRFHRVVADFVPPAEAVWRMGGRWAPGLIVGHNDAAPYNAVWRNGSVAGFIDWDMAGPVLAAWDLAFAAFSWVPLHAPHVVAREGFTDFEGRPRRLKRFLAEYGWTDSVPAFLDVVAARIQAHVTSLRDLAALDPLFARIVEQGGADDLEAGLAELDRFAERNAASRRDGNQRGGRYAAAVGSSVIVRPARVQDAAQMAQVVVRCWQETYRGLMSDAVLDDPGFPVAREQMWTAILTDERYRQNRVAVAERADGLVGVAMSGAPGDATAPWARQLYVLYVYAADHGTGIGQALLEAVINPADTAVLWVADPNPRAQAFYRKHGFVPDGTAQIEDGVREIRMVRGTGHHGT